MQEEKAKIELQKKGLIDNPNYDPLNEYKSSPFRVKSAPSKTAAKKAPGKK